MHLNILQYIDHIGGWRDFDELQIILTTPGVNLIEQHRAKRSSLKSLNQQCAGRIRLTIDSTQSLSNREKNYFDLPDHKRIFRLVFVDEGHIGLSSSVAELGKFKELRHNLADLPNAFVRVFRHLPRHLAADRHVEEYGEQIVYDYNLLPLLPGTATARTSVARTPTTLLTPDESAGKISPPPSEPLGGQACCLLKSCF